MYAAVVSIVKYWASSNWTLCRFSRSKPFCNSIPGARTLGLYSCIAWTEIAWHLTCNRHTEVSGQYCAASGSTCIITTNKWALDYMLVCEEHVWYVFVYGYFTTQKYEWNTPTQMQCMRSLNTISTLTCCSSIYTNHMKRERGYYNYKQLKSFFLTMCHGTYINLHVIAVEAMDGFPALWSPKI